MDSVVLSYGDSLLRQSDVLLLDRSKWLNDKIIGFAFEYFGADQFKQHGNSLSFLNPSIIQLVKMLPPSEAYSILSPLNLQSKRLLFLPLNDNDSLSSGGTHWSIVVCDVQQKSFFHFDSSPGSNEYSAKIFCNHLAKALSWPSRNLDCPPCPKQSNGYDCGVYVIAIAEYIATDYSQNREFPIDFHTMTNNIDADFIVHKRKEMKNLILTSPVRLKMRAAKRQLRKELKMRLSSLSEDDKLKQSSSVVCKLLQHPKYIASKRISVFLSMSDEVQTESILYNAFKSEKEVFIPRYLGPQMDMVQLKSMSDYEQLPETSWHIKQPAADDYTRVDALNSGGLDLILMPGLGFTTAGHRLGRGKGYYDSYIDKLGKSGFHPYLLALAYSVQICGEIPVTEHDKMVDEVLYPNR